LSLRATGLGSLDFLAEAESFALIIFKISYSRYSITDTLGVGNRFLIFITAIIFAISIAWLLLNATIGKSKIKA
jgi:hypothetical protein